MTERRERRTGIEGWDGRPLVYRQRDQRVMCIHYCEIHDHHWAHADPRCVRHEVVACGDKAGVGPDVQWQGHWDHRADAAGGTQGA